MTIFLIKHFPELITLNLAGNKIQEETTLYTLLDNLPKLKQINASNNQIYEINKEKERFFSTSKFSSIWTKLQVMNDVSIQTNFDKFVVCFVLSLFAFLKHI